MHIVAMTLCRCVAPAGTVQWCSRHLRMSGQVRHTPIALCVPLPPQQPLRPESSLPRVLAVNS